MKKYYFRETEELGKYYIVTFSNDFEYLKFITMMSAKYGFKVFNTIQPEYEDGYIAISYDIKNGSDKENFDVAYRYVSRCIMSTVREDNLIKISKNLLTNS